MPVNKMNQTELLKIIKEQFPNSQFSLKQILKTMPEFNHSKRVFTILKNLVDKEKLVLQENGKYKIVAYTARSFAVAFCSDKGLSVPSLRVEMALKKQFGNTITDTKKASRIARSVITAKAVGSACPRCRKPLVGVTLSKGKKALFCRSDRVCIPLKIGSY